MLECLWMAYMLKYMLEFLKDYEYLATWILLPIEIVFLYFLLKEFEITRKSFEWQEEEYNKKVEADIERKLKVICGFIYQRFYGQVKLEQQQNIIFPNQTDVLNVSTELKKDFGIPLDIVNKQFCCQTDRPNQSHDIKKVHVSVLKSHFRSVNIMTFIDYFSQNKKEAYNNINQCYDNIHNYWKTQTIGDQNDDSMIKMIWEQEK